MEDNKKRYLHIYEQAGETGEAFLDMLLKEAETSAFDQKMHELVYLAVLVTARLEHGIVVHTKEAKRLGATREEVNSAALAALPVIGFPAIMGLKTALASYDGEAKG